MRIRICDVTKRYAEEGTLRAAAQPPALDSVSLDIADGETVSLVGPSGCGKSSLLRVVAGLETPDAGRVVYDDQDVAAVRPQDRGVGMVFQDYALYPSMKGKGNLAYFFEVRQRDEDEARQRAREVAEIMGVGFEVLLDQRSTTLSGGEQQRVAIARCIVRDPTLFLMDEPISNLDAKLRESTRMEIKKLLRTFGITTVYVTHDQSEAFFMGDRVVVLRDGAIGQAGAFEELYYDPADLFVARFVGSRPLTVVPVDRQGAEARAEEGGWWLPDALADKLPSGPLRLGVRPEGWLVDTEQGVPMAVRRIEQIPTERLTLAHGTVAGASVTAMVPPETTSDSWIPLRPDWELASFFAAEDDTAIHTPGIPEFF